MPPSTNTCYHTIPACNRCRKRKSRCDTGRPFCSSCKHAGTPCEYTDPLTKRTIAREYISRLEYQLQSLELERSALQDGSETGKLENLEATNKDRSYEENPPNSGTDVQADLITLGDVGGDAHFLGVSSGMSMITFM
jgi:hypothetical protein